jgi:hypothetical protein
LCIKVIRSQERNQPVTEWAPELFLSLHLIGEAPNRSAGGRNESIPLNFSFEELRGPAHFEGLSTGFDSAVGKKQSRSSALRYGGSIILSLIIDAYSAT